MAPLRNIEMENDLTPKKVDEFFFSETLDILKVLKNLRSFDPQEVLDKLLLNLIIFATK